MKTKVATLSELRIAAGRTQSWLAERLGITQSAVAHLEASEEPRLSSLEAYARALGGVAAVTVTTLEADGSASSCILRMPGGPEPSVDPFSRRWRSPETKWPLHEAMLKRNRAGAR